MGSRPEYRTADAIRAVDEAYRLNAQGQLDAAVEVLDTFLGSEPSNAWVLATAGHLLRQAGRLQEAIERLDQALEQQPHSPYTLALRGDCQSQSGRVRTALADYEQALHLGISDTLRRTELCAATAEIYEFLGGESGSPLLSIKAGIWREEGTREATTAADAGVEERVSQHARALKDAVWQPCRSYARLGFGEALDDALLRLVRLRLSASEAWVPFDESVGLTLYTDQGRMQMVKASRSVRLGGQELIGLEVDDLRGLFGEPRQTEDLAEQWALDYPALGASFLAENGRVVEAVLGGD